MGTESQAPATLAPQVYNVELHIGKVVIGDRGDYRLEIKANDVCDSCPFNVDVEGAQAGPGALAGVGWMRLWKWGGHSLSEERVQIQEWERGRQGLQVLYIKRYRLRGYRCLAIWGVHAKA